ncbi:MAG TPA: hypothetical protein VNG94_04275 [Pyrinomonadaceae bacterium]|nr:hypothetical protein [Pyrinomonadaceae bacterium]
MRTAFILFVVLVTLIEGAAAPQSERTFTTIVVRDEQPAHRRIRLVDYDSNFAWVAQDFGDSRDFGGNTVPGVFVHSHRHNGWLQIMRVSTAGAKFGRAPDNAMIQAPWDFTSLASRKFVSLPIMGGSAIHLPDKAFYDASRDVYVLYFDSYARIDSMTTTLIISKKDLDAAFDH